MVLRTDDGLSRMLEAEGQRAENGEQRRMTKATPTNAKLRLETAK